MTGLFEKIKQNFNKLIGFFKKGWPSFELNFVGDNE